jgi:hypothetical protein
VFIKEGVVLILIGRESAITIGIRLEEWTIIYIIIGGIWDSHYRLEEIVIGASKEILSIIKHLWIDRGRSSNTVLGEEIASKLTSVVDGLGVAEVGLIPSGVEEEIEGEWRVGSIEHEGGSHHLIVKISSLPMGTLRLWSTLIL